VKFVCAGFADGIDGPAIAGILSAVSAGQRLKFGDGLDAQRSAGHVSAGVALPPVQHILAIQHVGVAFGPGAGDRVSVRHGSKRAAAALRISRYARRQQNQLFEIAAVEGKLPHLGLVHQRRHGGGSRFDLGNIGGHVDALRRLAYGQLKIDYGRASNLQNDSGMNASLEA
jgi:hypothetical protein